MRIFVLAGMLLLFILSNACASSGGPRRPDARDLERLRAEEAAAKQARGPDAERAWFVLARDCVMLWWAAEGDPKTRKKIAEPLARACEHLGTRSLAAVAAVQWNPVVNRGFERALLREGTEKNRWSGWAAPEAAADCRDAQVQQRNRGLGDFPCDDLVKGAAARGAGGAVQSVYRISVLGGQGWKDEVGRFCAGVRAGLREELGTEAERVRLTSNADYFTPESELNFELSNGDGVLVVPVPSETLFRTARTAGSAAGVLVVDARPADSVPFPHPAELGYAGRWFGEEKSRGPLDFRLPLMDSTMARIEWNVAGRPWGPEIDPVSVALRPSEMDRARRLGKALANRWDLRKIAIALPESGGNVRLARAFGEVLDALKREGVPVSYSRGRVDRTAELLQLQKQGVQAILFAGPIEETADWLSALSDTRSKIIVLGGVDLDPSGFHPREQKALEGALLVAEEWDESPDDSTRGARLGRGIGRGIKAGAITPARLAQFLSRRAMMADLAQYSDGGDSATPENLAAIQIYRVRDGKTERLP